MLICRYRLQGFSVIELMVVVVILAVLLMLAVPSLNGWLATTRIKAKADSALNGLQLARMEALKRNARVEFRTGGDTSWQVCLVSDNCAAPIHSAPATESGSGVTQITTPDGAARVTYSGVGTTASNADGSSAVTMMEFSDPQAYEGSVWQVRITDSGQARLCNPSLTSGPDQC